MQITSKIIRFVYYNTFISQDGYYPVEWCWRSKDYTEMENILIPDLTV